MSAIENEVPIIGISPRNSYYSDKENIAFAITEVVREFGKAYVFIPGLLDRHNYIAYGYGEKRATDKASSLGHALTMAVHEICKRENLSYADHGNSPAQVRIIKWDGEIEKNPVYKEKLGDILKLYNANPDFRQDIRAATLKSIESRMSSNSEARNYIQKTGIDPAIDCAANYILGEFAFLEAAPDIFGGNHLTYFYHREWDVFEKYINGNYGCAHPAQSFRVISREVSVT